MSLPSSTAASPTPPEAPSTASVSPGCSPGAVLERVIGGAVGDGQRGRALEVEVGGELDDLVGRDRRALARGVEIGVAHDPVAGCERGDAGADALDHAGELAARRERERRLGLVLAGDDQRVEEIQADGRDLGHDLARPGDRIGDVREHEVVGGAEAMAENGFHGAARMVRGRCYSTAAT